MEPNTRFLPFEGETPPYEPQRKKRGCVFYGCLAAIVVSILLSILLGGGIFMLYRGISKFVQEYGDDAPRPIAVSELPADELKGLEEKVVAFQAAIEAETPAEPLILTAVQINALIDSNPDFKGVVAVDFAGDKVRGEVSFPMAKLGFPGKFINGTATFDVRVENDRLLITFDSLEVKGKAIPEDIMSKLRMENLAKDSSNDPKVAKQIAQIEKVEVKDGKLVITPKQRPVAKEGDAKADAAPDEAKSEPPKVPEKPETKPAETKTEPAKKAA